jgi:ferrochelatase
MFSAHSLPMLVINRGDPYSVEVAATVHGVMTKLQQRKHSNSHMLAWQSQVGYLPWLGPNTGDALKGLGKQGHKHVLVVPIAFTSDHVETLFEIDQEYAEMAHKAGIKYFARTESLNGSGLLAKAQAHIVAEHIKSQVACSNQYALNCSDCTNEICRSILNSEYPYVKLRDMKQTNGDSHNL